MSELKRDSTASFPDDERETKKKRKLDHSSSSGPASAYDVKQGADGIEDPPLTEISDILDSLSASVEKTPSRVFLNIDGIKAGRDGSSPMIRIKYGGSSSSSASGSVISNKAGRDGSRPIIRPTIRIKYGGSSSSSVRGIAIKNQDDKADDYDSQITQKPSSPNVVFSLEESASGSDTDDKFLVYEKRLTWDDVFYRRLVIPLEDAIEFLPEPSKYGGRYELTELKLMDHEKQMWNMRASFYELCNSYLFWENWDKYVNKYELEPDDVIFLYEDWSFAADDTYLLIEFEKRKPDNNPIEEASG